jgi:hypothetical protein
MKAAAAESPADYSFALALSPSADETPWNLDDAGSSTPAAAGPTGLRLRQEHPR